VKHQVTLALALLVIGGVGATRAVETSELSAPPVRRLTNPHSSVDDLVESFRQALIAKDKDTLRSLRVTRDEYLGIILPGSVEPGQQRATWARDAQQYFWGSLNGKSIYAEANLLAEYGGHPFRVTQVQYRKGVKDYADYKAYKQLVLTLEDDAGRVDHLRIGSVAEVDGQFKFISYVRD